MKKKTFLITISAFLLGILISAFSCYIIYTKKINKFESSIKSSTNDSLGTENKISFDWLDDSGEAEALEYQAYNSATTSLNQIAKEPTSKPKAVILDIDETCLNNEPFQGYEIENNNGVFNYNTWCQWVNFAEAKAIPGAVEFTQQAKKDGVQVFYVSGRSQDQLAKTVQNLNNCGFADATEPGHVVLYPSSQNGKQPSFDQIEKNYDVEMFVGDQLPDMGSQFQNKTNDQEKQLVTEDKADWGSKYIMIPDPIYGNYLNSIFKYQAETESQQISNINSNIQTFNPQTGKVSYC